MKIFIIVVFAVPSCVWATGSAEECGIIPSSAQSLRRRRSTESNAAPWHVTIYNKKTKPYTQICSGALVTNKAVISVAHCYYNELENKLQPADNFAAAVGKLHRAWDAAEDQHVQKSNISEIKVPLRFHGITTNYQDDIAVLILKSGITFNAYVVPVCLHFDSALEQRQLQANAVGQVSGWGSLGPEHKPSNTLKVLEIPYVTIETCFLSSLPEARAFLTADKICAGLKNGTSLCRGDSGAPYTFPENANHQTKHYLRGVASTSLKVDVECNTKPSINMFTQVSKHEQFIEENM